jgi:hypothetical protein
MNKTLLFILALLLVLSCKEQGNKSVTDSYLDQPVGINNDGKFEITNLNVIKDQWQAALKSEHYDEQLTNFTIKKSLTQGEAQQDYYILLGKNDKGTIKTAAILNLKGNKFYFEKQEGAESLVYLKILCAGDCPSGCDPVVNVVNNKKFLICTPCEDCFKADKEMR